LSLLASQAEWVRPRGGKSSALTQPILHERCGCKRIRNKRTALRTCCGAI